VELGRKIAQALEAATFERVAGIGLANAERNRPRIARSVLELAETPLGTGDAAIVVGAGPSLHRRRSLERLRASGFAGTIVAADGALGACLRAGVVPHVVVSVDPHPERIVRWFGDPTLMAPRDDDYFRRQEMDPEHRADEIGANRVLVDLVDAYGPKIKVAAATSAAPAVVERCEQAGMDIYWWNPMYDDYDKPDSLSRRLWEMNGLPCLNGGGNVGTAAWVLTHAVLGKRRIGLIGIDLGYAPGTSFEKTQYYPELRDMLGDRYREAFIHTRNPSTGETWFSDPAYHWFRDVFLEMARDADCQTVNCTEGGLLFGPGITTAALDTFLETAAGGTQSHG
jgi:Protein of unknown function DUF115